MIMGLKWCLVSLKIETWRGLLVLYFNSILCLNNIDYVTELSFQCFVLYNSCIALFCNPDVKNKNRCTPSCLTRNKLCRRKPISRLLRWFAPRLHFHCRTKVVSNSSFVEMRIKSATSQSNHLNLRAGFYRIKCDSVAYLNFPSLVVACFLPKCEL